MSQDQMHMHHKRYDSATHLADTQSTEYSRNASNMSRRLFSLGGMDPVRIFVDAVVYPAALWCRYAYDLVKRNLARFCFLTASAAKRHFTYGAILS